MVLRDSIPEETGERCIHFFVIVITKFCNFVIVIPILLLFEVDACKC